MYKLLLFLVLLCTSCTQYTNGTNYSKYNKIVSTINFNKYNASKKYVILVDYSILSNRDRMFVYDLKAHKIVYSCWCAHGFGKGSTAVNPVFSNEVGSNCSSLGLFAIDKWEGTSAHYGYNYHSVEGLSKSNSNARKRQLLIHYWYSVTEDCKNKISTPMACDYRSAGCFTTTYSAYKHIHMLINSENKRILLYAFK